MTPAQRAFLGALIGALGVLLMHPASRPYLLEGSLRYGASQAVENSPHLPENLETLDDPVTLESAAVWQLVGAEKMLRARRLGEPEALQLIEVARNAAAVDPDNAYWRQMESLLLFRIGDRAASIEAWLTASQATRWDDLQTQRLEKLLRDLSKESGRTLAWHYSIGQRKRSSASTDLLYSHAIALLTVESTDEERILWQVATTLNGQKIRNGARSVTSAQNGYRIVRIGALGSAAESLSIRELHDSPVQYERSKGALYASLKEHQLERDLPGMQDAFDTNEAWMALVPASKAEDNARALSSRAAVASTLPGTLLAMGILGLVPFTIGLLFLKFERSQLLFDIPFAPLLGVAVGVYTYVSTGLVFFAVWLTFTLSLFAVVTPRLRKSSVLNPGPYFGLLQSLLAVVFAFPAVAFLVGLTSAGRTVFSLETTTPELGPGSKFLASLAVLALSLVIASGPVIALLYRTRPQRMAAHSLRSFGLALTVGSLSLSVLSTPVSMVWDSRLQTDLSRVFLNEPTYYLTRE